ncbi:Choline-sulfatase [Anatilimnocola aggregata]|uniref:Choline-sulfatase n=1 Tax=Anatilimnocola aggregata TaxID=2528021 RepID=A0A517YJY9_9BACT|nr:sulfatase [Anatilimnocola aggregata]QDU30533.1 Choline-sulfatase [Anatilimnocola aggregata]
MSRFFMFAVLLCLFHLNVVGSALADKPAQARPNILVLMADNWAWPHASAYGDGVVKTPTFDALAREGTLFTRAYCSVPSCSPARAVFLTGQAAHRLEDAASLHSQFPARLKVFPQLLADSGYATGFSGKGWGPGNWSATGLTHNPAGQPYDDLGAFLQAVPKDKPFCFWLSSKDPHVPWTEGRDFLPALDRSRVTVPPVFPDHPAVREDLLHYYCEVQNFDRTCGQAIELLKQRGVFENTIIVMLGDNGWQMPRGLAHMYDLSTHVPLVIRSPTHLSNAAKCEAFVNFEDLAPTLLELVGLPVPAEMTGLSLRPILAGEPVEGRDEVFLERERHANVRAGDVGYPCRAIRTKDFLYIRNLRPDRWPAGDPELHFSVGPFGDVDNSPTKELILSHREEPAMAPFYRMIFAKRPAEELYDLNADPGETMNVADRTEFATVKRELHARLEKWRQTTGDPRSTRDDDRWDRFPYYGNRAKAAVAK